MCWTCFKKYADAPVINDRVVAAYDVLHGAMGPKSTITGLWLPPRGNDPASSDLLHVIVGDMNVDDWLFDLTDPDNAWRADRYPTASQWERDIFDALAALSEEERATAVAMEWGYVSRDGTLRPDLVSA